MQLNDVPRLRDYLVQRLRPLTDADPDALADYTIALLRHEKGSAGEMQAFCSRQLREFMRADADADAFSAGLVRYVSGSGPERSMPRNEHSTSAGPDRGMPRNEHNMSGGPDRGMPRNDYGAGRYRGDAPYDRHERPPTDRQPYGRPPYERQAPERPPYDRQAPERPPYERSPYDRQVSERPPYERPPYDRQASERPPYERPPYERPNYERPQTRPDERVGSRAPGRTFGPRPTNRSVSPPRGPVRHDGRYERRPDDRNGGRFERQEGRYERTEGRTVVRGPPRRPETPENLAVVHIDGLPESLFAVGAVAGVLERFGALRSITLRGTAPGGRVDAEFARVEDAREAVSKGVAAFGTEGLTLWTGDLRASLDAQERTAAPEISERQREAIRNMAALQQKKQEMLALHLEARADLVSRLAAMSADDPSHEEISTSIARTDDLIRSLGGVPPGESAPRQSRTENLSLDLRPTVVAIRPAPPALADPAAARTALEAHGAVRDISMSLDGALIATFARHDDAERAIARLRDTDFGAPFAVDWAPRDAPSN